MAIDINTNAFLALVKAGLWEKEARLSQYGKVDYEEVMRLAEEQSVAGLLTAGLEQVQDVKVPQETLLQFIGQALQIEQQNAEMNMFIAGLVETMRKEGIYTLLVKGQIVAQCYEKPLWRSSGDVDFFLSEDNYNKARAFLLPLASSSEQEWHSSKHLGMTIDGWTVEIHGSLCGSLSRRVNEVLRKIQNETFYEGNVSSWENNGVQVFSLGRENHIFYVFTHFLNHFYKGGIGLRQICDWCRMLWSNRKELNRKDLEQKVKKAGLLSEWREFGAFAVEYLGMPVEAMPMFDPNFKFQDSGIKRKAERIKDFILMSGNFGHNRDMSYYEKYPFVIRKCMSMWRRTGDMINHARIFPLDSLKFFPYMMFCGVRSAMRGEG